jgi:phosphoribosyl 1,2-cyclic phosphate phosphodiesterase
MKITFLGTGTSQGIPVIACECQVCSSADVKDCRLRSSILVETNQTTLVIDTGPDFRQQMLKFKVKNLNGVVFTHEHKDHVAGLDDVRAYNFHQEENMDVYAHPRVQEALKREFYYAFDNTSYPGVPRLNLKDIGNEKFTVGDIELTPIEVLHYKMPVLGFRIKDFTYITDANYISDESIEKIRGSKILVLNALRRKKHVSHFTLDEAVEMAKRIKAPKTYLTHISHLMGTHADTMKDLPNGIEVAWDGLQFEI